MQRAGPSTNLRICAVPRSRADESTVMTRGAAILAFLRSREGNGWIGILLFAAALAFAVAFGFFQASLKSFVASKIVERLTATELVDAFVGGYADLRHHLGTDGAPSPSTFRVQSLQRFNESAGQNVLHLGWVDRQGKATSASLADPAMAEIVEGFAVASDPQPVSDFEIVEGERVFRTIYP